MPVTIIPQMTSNFQIPFQERARSYGESVGGSDQATTRELVVAWDQRYPFRSDMLGYSVDVGGFLGRFPPNSHPEFPQMYCTECTMIEPEGPNSQNSAYDGAVQYTNAVYRCTYKPLMYRVATDDQINTEMDRFIIRKDKYSFEQLKIPGNFFVYTDGFGGALGVPGQVPNVPAVPWGIVEMEYTWKQIPFTLVPKALLLMYKNCMNNAPFDQNSMLPDGELSSGYDDKLVLFNNVERHDYIQPNFDYVSDLVMTFVLREQPWDQILGSDGKFHPIVNSKTGLPAYGLQDLNQLFDI